MGPNGITKTGACDRQPRARAVLADDEWNDLMLPHVPAPEKAALNSPVGRNDAIGRGGRARNAATRAAAGMAGVLAPALLCAVKKAPDSPQASFSRLPGAIPADKWSRIYMVQRFGRRQGRVRPGVCEFDGML
jgi:hypothetical protein